MSSSFRFIEQNKGTTSHSHFKIQKLVKHSQKINIAAFTVDEVVFKTTQTTLYGCRHRRRRCRRRHFASFHSQPMIEFTVTLHNAVARKSYLSIESATFIVDIDGFQTDWQLICTLNTLLQLKALTMSLSTFQLCFNEQRYHQQLY